MELLNEILTKYDYPSKLLDFSSNKEISFSNYRELECYIKTELKSHDILKIKDGLSNVLYWGHYRAGYRDFRVNTFRNNVADPQLLRFKELMTDNLDNLINIKAIKMPEFSGLAFISKIKMFTDPTRFVTLDKKIMQLRDESNCKNPLNGISYSNKETSIRITKKSEIQYNKWCVICRLISEQYFQGKIAADIERGFFKLVEENNIEKGKEIIRIVTNKYNMC